MTIEHFTSSTLSKDELPYTIVCNKTVHDIRDVTALAVWTYLQTKPQNWVIYRQEVAAHFNIGRDKVREAFLLLEEMGLLTSEQKRNKKGQYLRPTTILHSVSKKYKYTQEENKITYNEPKPPATDLPAPDFQSPVHYLVNNKDNKIISSSSNYIPGKKSETTTDVFLDYDLIQLATEKGFSRKELDFIVEKFNTYYINSELNFEELRLRLKGWILREKKNTLGSGGIFINRSSESSKTDLNGNSNLTLHYTAWLKSFCRKNLGHWSNDYTLLGHEEQWFKKKYADYLTTGVL